MSCQWIHGQDGYLHWGTYVAPHRWRSCDTTNVPMGGVTNDPYTFILVVFILAGLIYLLYLLFSDDKKKLPDPPDPLDETRQTNEARKSRRKQAPLAQNIEWDVKIEKTTVALYLRLSPDEYKLIRQYGLDDIECESAPMYSVEELEEIRERHAADEAKIADTYKREFLRIAHEEAFDRYRHQKLIVRFGDYIGDYPYTRVFRERLPATQYGDQLKRAILPRIKKEIEEREAEAEDWTTV